jgi:hypothetical protein
MKKGVLVLMLFLVFLNGKAQTGIGTTTPSPSAKLEVASTNQGFLPPRIALTATNAASPVTSPATGLLVYNTATAGTAPNNVVPGFYYWKGTLWVRLNGPSDNAANVTGVVPVANGGTGVTTATGSGKTVLSDNPTLELLSISSGASQFPSSIFVTPTTFATSKRAALWLGDWGLLQDFDGNGQPNFSITQNFSGSYPTRFFISTAGNVGLGTSSPTAKLNLVGGGIRIFNGFSNNSTSRPPLNTLTIGNYEIRGVGGGGGSVQSDGGDDGFLRLSAGGGSSTSAQSSIDLSGYSNVADMLNNIVMRTAGAERLRIDNTGNVGIGTSSPTVRLQVAGDIIANSIAGSSDARFKTHITPIENPLQKVLQLRGVHFDWNTKDFPDRKFSDQKAIGLIAQEVEKVLPEVVQTEKTPEGYKAVQYDKVVALLVEAIKEQQKQIDRLKLELKKEKNKQ